MLVGRHMHRNLSSVLSQRLQPTEATDNFGTYIQTRAYGMHAMRMQDPRDLRPRGLSQGQQVAAAGVSTLAMIDFEP